jgi:hypothetical protein
MGHLVSALIQFTVAQPVLFEDDSHCVRVAGYLLLEQFVYTNIRECYSSIIPVV